MPLSRQGHGRRGSRLAAQLARCTAQRDPYACEYRVLWPDGTVHWVAGRGAFVFDGTGRAARMYGTVVEVTERYRVEQALNRYRQIVETSSEITSWCRSASPSPTPQAG
ncbi:PAS domain-containing protein [uncultured Thiodictyon sp.]|uniref:PAS domain-containing protein n=1 Tax=uncultured Thiodictyon sp. TaxID=1846217 RepID=UPI0025F78331|nr:PAS domain-containing protein [uncultured Thiodictyon sp.]